MEDCFSVPLIISKDSRNPVDTDLTLALVLWSLEDEREKGGGLFRKKAPELVRQVSFLSRPILITKYGNSVAVFDGCGIHSTRPTFGIAPSLTHLGSYLISSNWPSKPDSYAEGLDRHSHSFEQARNEHTQEIPGWIIDPALTQDLGETLAAAYPSDARPDALPLLVDFERARAELQSLDKAKHLIQSEIPSLQDMKQKLKERTSEVLAPLKRECTLIEEKWDREIDKIRPSVLDTKERLENERASQHHKIEARFSGRLHDLRNRRDAAQSKIDAYDPYSGREPRGGIDKQYSTKESAERRIRELEREQEEQISAVDEKYDGLVSEQEERIDSLERKKQDALKEPKGKIQRVEKATNRLSNAIGALLQDHQTFMGLGTSSNIQIPGGPKSNELVLYIPFVQVRFDDGKEPRSKILCSSSLKEGKGVLGSFKSLIKMKTMPLDQKWKALVSFMETLNTDPNSARVLSVVARRNDALSNPETKTLLSSGLAKLRSRGWISEKDAIEFGNTVEKYYVPSGPQEVLTAGRGADEHPGELKPESRPLVRFINYLGEEKLVAMDELEATRKEDQAQFALGAQKLVTEQRQKEEESSLLNAVVEAIQEFRPSRRYHNEFPYQAELQGWLKSRFPSSKIEIQTGASRPDIVIEDIAIEVKGPTDNRALETLTTKCLKYSGYYDKIVMVLFEPVFSESNFREIEAGIERHFPYVRVIRKDEVY